jgi:hypothetical protein
VKITKLVGYQLEKSVPTSPEDGFVRSEVGYMDGGEEKVFSIVYLEFFEHHLQQFSPFQEDPIYTVGDKQYVFKEIAAFTVLISNPSLIKTKRLYVHDLEQFIKLFKKTDWEYIKQCMIKFVNEANFPINV